MALVGLTALALDPNQTLTFEPWGCAAALLFTWLIVRSEVLVASEGLTAKARVAAIQTGTVAAQRSSGPPPNSTPTRDSPRRIRETLGARLRRGGAPARPADVPRHPAGGGGRARTRGGESIHARVRHARLRARPHRRRRVAGPRRRRGRVTLANGVGRLSWGEAIEVRRHRAAGGPVPRAAFADDRRRRRESGLLEEKLWAPEVFLWGNTSSDDAPGSRVGVVRGTGRFIGFRRVIDRVRGKEDRSRATAEGVFGSVVGNLLKNPAWAVKAQAKGSSAAKGGAELAAALAARVRHPSKLVAAGKAGKGVPPRGKSAAAPSPPPPRSGCGASDTGAGLDALAGLFGDGGVGASNVAATTCFGDELTKATAAARRRRGASRGPRRRRSPRRAVSAGKAASVGAALKAASLSAAAVAGAGRGRGDLFGPRFFPTSGGA